MRRATLLATALAVCGLAQMAAAQRPTAAPAPPTPQAGDDSRAIVPEPRSVASRLQEAERPTPTEPSAQPAAPPADVPAFTPEKPAARQPASKEIVVDDNCPTRSGLWHGHIKPCLQESHWGYAEYFHQPAFGAAVRASLAAQVCNGTTDRLVLYRYDFCNNGEPQPTLNAAGQRRLRQMAAILKSCPEHAVLVEPYPGKPELNAARVSAVIQQLQDLGAPPQASLGRPPFGARALSADDAKAISDSLRSATAQGGTLSSNSNNSSSSSASASGAGGGSASGGGQPAQQ